MSPRDKDTAAGDRPRNACDFRGGTWRHSHLFLTRNQWALLHDMAAAELLRNQQAKVTGRFAGKRYGSAFKDR
jgi:ligand-binding SRPBCC domain-containing protein